MENCSLHFEIKQRNILDSFNALLTMIFICCLIWDGFVILTFYIEIWFNNSHRLFSCLFYGLSFNLHSYFFLDGNKIQIHFFCCFISILLIFFIIYSNLNLFSLNRYVYTVYSGFNCFLDEVNVFLLVFR